MNYSEIYLILIINKSIIFIGNYSYSFFGSHPFHKLDHFPANNFLALAIKNINQRPMPIIFVRFSIFFIIKSTNIMNIIKETKMDLSSYFFKSVNSRNDITIWSHSSISFGRNEP